MLTFRIHTKPVYNLSNVHITNERLLQGYLTNSGEVLISKTLNQFEYDILVDNNLLSDVTMTMLPPDKRMTEKLEMIKL